MTIVERMELFRFAFGRWLVHAGLSIMPQSRARSELFQLFELWGTKAQRAIAEHKRR